MMLRDILTKLSQDKSPVLLNDGNKDWEAGELLESLSEPMLKRNAHLQQGLYIAEIDDGGYLREVLYKVKRKA